MDVLLVGSGGREHAIAWKLSQSQLLDRLYIAPGNAGTAVCGQNVPIKAEDIKGLVDFAVTRDIGLVVVGPEAPLADGLVDALEGSGKKAFGPTRKAAQLEADKAFAKQLMRSCNVASAEGRIFDRFSHAKKYIASRDESVVVKACGLAQGKGVFVCDEPSEAILAAEKIMVKGVFGKAGRKIIVEEKLIGQEASVLAFVDGRNIYLMEACQDHKAIGEGDTGPNTGGMGAYCPAPVVSEDITRRVISEIIVPIVDGMNCGGTPYKGVLYAGIMVTGGGPRVLEFNCRFGDPETQPLMMRLNGDLLEVMLAVCDGRLDEISFEWDPRPSVCVVMASGGYPGNYLKGKPIKGLEAAGSAEDVMVFHAGTAIADGLTVTSGGRVLGITALGTDIAAAKKKAYDAVGRIEFEGAYYRRDIADKALDKIRRV